MCENWIDSFVLIGWKELPLYGQHSSEPSRKVLGYKYEMSSCVTSGLWVCAGNSRTDCLTGFQCEFFVRKHFHPDALQREDCHVRTWLADSSHLCHPPATCHITSPLSAHRSLCIFVWLFLWGMFASFFYEPSQLFSVNGPMMLCMDRAVLSLHYIHMDNFALCYVSG